MPVYINITNCIFDKKAVEKRVKGGLEAFRNDYFLRHSELSQEDDELFLVAGNSYYTFDVAKLMEMGFEFDVEKQYSNDFVITHRYNGRLWDVDWLEDNSFHAWHRDTDDRLKAQVKLIGDLTLDEVGDLMDAGETPLMQLTLENLESHPLSVFLRKKGKGG